MNITLPNSLEQYVLAKVASGGYGSVSDYIGELVRADREQASFEADVLKGLECGESTPVTDDDWNDLRSRLQRPA